VIPDLLLLQSMFFNPSVILTPLSLRTPPLYFALQNTGEEVNTLRCIVFVFLPYISVRKYPVVLRGTAGERLNASFLKRFAPALYETKRRGECCYGTICIDYLPLSITRVAFFKPLDVASRVIFPGSSVDDTMAVIMPENTFMWGAWNDSNDVGSPLAPAR